MITKDDGGAWKCESPSLSSGPFPPVFLWHFGTMLFVLLCSLNQISYRWMDVGVCLSVCVVRWLDR